MIHRRLQIGRWIVDFLFADDKGYDRGDVFSYLYNAYAPDRVMDEAETLMDSCDYNCGFTYANQDRRMAVVMVGPTTSGAEFQDTFVHEIRHLADNIAQSLGIRLHGEPVAYLSGDMARDLADVVCRLGCDGCRKKRIGKSREIRNPRTLH